MTWNEVLIASLIGIVIVFAILMMLVFAFKLVARLSMKNSQKRMQKQGVKLGDTANPTHITSTEVAAISMALHMMFEDAHDLESNIITIKRIERRYSPWNSKIYGLTNLIR